MVMAGAAVVAAATDPAMEWFQCGADNGRMVIYFHGAPGAPDEAHTFAAAAKAHDVTLVCVDRFSLAPSLAGEAYYQQLAKTIDRLAGNKPVVLIGFSIGAFVAIQTCRYLTCEIRHLHLVSAAAPLEGGNYLDAMAGKAVFMVAKTFPLAFLLLSCWQGLLALMFPAALFRLLFASAVGADLALAQDPSFQTAMSKVLHACFVRRVRGYVRDVCAYVQPWQKTLAEVGVTTTLWHGSQDNWSPVAMADYLRSALPGCGEKKIMDGLSHYSCLYQAVPEIFARSAMR